MAELNYKPADQLAYESERFRMHLYQLAAFIAVAIVALVLFAPFELAVLMVVPLVVLVLIACVFGALGWHGWSRIGALWIGILILTVWILPELLRGNHPPDHESPPVGDLRTINTAEVSYLSSSGGNYGTLPELIAAGLLESTFAETRSGYRFHVIANGSDYTATALPISAGKDKYGYYSAPDAVIRYVFDQKESCKPCFPKGQAGQAVQ